MAKISSVATIALLCLAVVLVAEVHMTEAVTCNMMALRPCLDSMQGSAPPTKECCDRLREQQPCFCQYINNPMLKPYIDSPNAKRVSATCGLPRPHC